MEEKRKHRWGRRENGDWDRFEGPYDHKIIVDLDAPEVDYEITFYEKRDPPFPDRAWRVYMLGWNEEEALAKARRQWLFWVPLRMLVPPEMHELKARRLDRDKDKTSLYYYEVVYYDDWKAGKFGKDLRACKIINGKASTYAGHAYVLGNELVADLSKPFVREHKKITPEEKGELFKCVMRDVFGNGK